MIVLSSSGFGDPEAAARAAAQERYDSIYEEAVLMIKKYETMHKQRHWPLIGYGHLVMAGEKYRRGVVLSESEADAVLRNDLLKNAAFFRKYGADSLLLGVLAYNIGCGNVAKSTFLKQLSAGDRGPAMRELYMMYSRIHGRPHKGLRQRRADEYDLLINLDSMVRARADEVRARLGGRGTPRENTATKIPLPVRRQTPAKPSVPKPTYRPPHAAQNASDK